MKKRVQREYKLHTAIIEHLDSAWPQIEYTHAGKARDATHAHFLSKMGYKAGTGDIIWCCMGKFGDMEVKEPNGTQSSDQKTRETELTRNGGLYTIVRSVKESHGYFASLGFKPMHNAIQEPSFATWEDKIAAMKELYKP